MNFHSNMAGYMMERFSISVVLASLGLIALSLFFVIDSAPSIKPQQTDSPGAEVRVLRFGHNTPTDSALHQAALLFSEKVKQKSQGQVLIEVYPAQQLGNDHQMVEMARQGDLDIILTPTAKMSVPVPAIQYADLPFFFPSRDDVYAMLDGQPGEILLQKLNSIDLFGVTFWENGFKHFTGNQPFLVPEDFSGKRIRVMKSRIIMDQFQSFGSEPITIDFHATREALADGVVDGQENPLIAIYSMGFHEVQSDLVLSEHAYLGYVLSISQKTMASLPFDLQNLLITTAREVTPLEREDTQQREQQLLARIQQSGVKIHQLTPQQRQQFADLTSHIPRRFEAIIGTDVISKTEALLFEKYGPSPVAGDHLVIGLNADLSGQAGLAIKRGVQLAIKEINLQGGILGKQLYLLAKDHKVLPDTGLDNLDYFIGRPDVIAVVGGKHSAVVAEEMAIVSEQSMPYLIPWAASKKLTAADEPSQSIFRISANDRLASEFIASYARKHYRKPALIVENTIWGRGNLDDIKTYLTSQGIMPSYEAVINRGQMSYRSQLEDAMQAGADSVILIVNTHEGNIIIPELFELNKQLPIISHWGILGEGFAEQHRSILNELNLSFFQTFIFDESQRPQAAVLEQAYRNEYGLNATEQIHAQHAVAQAYDLVKLLAVAVEKAGSPEREHIISALESLPPYEGVIKRYRSAFSPDSHDGLDVSDFKMARFNESGHIVSVNK